MAQFFPFVPLLLKYESFFPKLSGRTAHMQSVEVNHRDRRSYVHTKHMNILFVSSFLMKPICKTPRHSKWQAHGDD